MRENRKYGSVRGSRQFLHSVSIDERSVETVYSTAGEAKKAFEVARKMLARKMSVSDIIDITGLDERDILSIQ
ncbi:hypothetical protein FACS1894187_02220 [Synergistales bacterium]|nr:hypothetical protein FACS1894187_02220 [Synergistales bacterium]